MRADFESAVERCWPSTIQAARFPSGKIGNSRTPGSDVWRTPSGVGPRDCLNSTTGSRAKIIAFGNRTSF